MNKLLKILFSIFIILIISFHVFLIIVIREIGWSYKVMDFGEYIQDYQTIANLGIDLIGGIENERIFLLVGYEEGSGKYTLSILYLGSEDPSEKLNLSEEEQKSLETIIMKSFRRGNGYDLDGIRIEGGFVVFESLNGPRLLYSYTGKNPREFYTKSEGYSFRMARINWYHMKRQI